MGRAYKGQRPASLQARPREGAQIMKQQHGFTLLELLVVIVIIGLLAGYVAPRYFSQVGRSEVQVARSQIDALEKALDQFRLDKRRYPSAEEGLAAVQPYMKKTLPNDPWGHP